MRKRIVIIVLAMALALPAALFAGGSNNNTCATKYPIVLAHGMGFSAQVCGVVDYWWGIESALEDQGANVYITSVNGMDGTSAKAASWRNQVLQILAVTGKSKVNVIGHSHGTLYSRYAISNLGLASNVVSYTSLCGPHRGSAIADLLMYGIPDSMKGTIGAVIDSLYVFVFGDDNPNSIQNGWDLTRSFMTGTFNPNTPDRSGIYYQSWAAKANWGCPSVVLEPTWLILKGIEGDNDGLVSVTSAKWGNYRGVKSGSWWSPGVDHAGMINHFFGITPGFDAPTFYKEIVGDLKNRGY